MNVGIRNALAQVAMRWIFPGVALAAAGGSERFAAADAAAAGWLQSPLLVAALGWLPLVVVGFGFLAHQV